MSVTENSFRGRAIFTMGAAVEHEWAPEQLAAWTGLAEVAVRLRRAHDDELVAKHELGISMVGLLGRLADTEQQMARLTDLAVAMGLSLARVSRIADVLERRGLIERVRCPLDARAVNARLTSSGLIEAHEAQATVRAAVERDFLGTLSAGQVKDLAAAFEHLITGLNACDPGSTRSGR